MTEPTPYAMTTKETLNRICMGIWLSLPADVARDVTNQFRKLYFERDAALEVAANKAHYWCRSAGCNKEKDDCMIRCAQEVAADVHSILEKK